MKCVVNDDQIPTVTRLARELDRRLVGLRAGVAEKDLAAEAALRKPLRQPHCGLCVKQVGDVHQRSDLLAHCRHHPRGTMTKICHTNSPQEVEVLLAVLVVEPRSLSPHELHREARVGADHATALYLLQLSDGHVPATILVPMPASVNSSSSSEWGMRPSMMWADETPPSIASTQAASFGRMPPCWLS